MGYYTSYTLSILEGDDEEQLIPEFRKDSVGARYAIDEYGDTNESCKWCDSKSDLIEFSKKHPGAIFCLEAEGEEKSDDKWKLYVKEGFIQECRSRIIFPEFDKSKLLSDIRDSKIEKIIE